VLGELSGEDESDSGLDLSGGESVLLVVSDKLGGLEGDLLEDVVDERVHDSHGSLGDSSVGVNLLEDSVNVDGEGLSSLLLVNLGGGGSSLLLGALSGGGVLGGSGLSGHFDFLLYLDFPQPFKLPAKN